MKKSSILVAGALSLAIMGCASQRNVNFSERPSSFVSEADSLYALSTQSIEDGNFDSSIGYLEEILIIKGDNTEKEILFNYGMARTHLGMASDYGKERQKNRQTALEYFRKVIDLTEEDVQFNSYRLKSEAWAKYLSN